MNRQSGSPRPDKSTTLQKLKGFQRRTVDHVVDRLLDPAGSRRFLVADEVGLGKTLIARGVYPSRGPRRDELTAGVL